VLTRPRTHATGPRIPSATALEEAVFAGMFGEPGIYASRTRVEVQRAAALVLAVARLLGMDSAQTLTQRGAEAFERLRERLRDPGDGRSV